MPTAAGEPAGDLAAGLPAGHLDGPERRDGEHHREHEHGEPGPQQHDPERVVAEPVTGEDPPVEASVVVGHRRLLSVGLGVGPSAVRVGEVDEQVLQRHGVELEAELAGAATLAIVEFAVDGVAAGRPELLGRQHVQVAGECRDGSAGPVTAAPRARSSSASSCSSSRPWSMMVTVSNSDATSSMWWVERMNVRGCSRWSASSSS
jgi:hypothetical protein